MQHDREDLERMIDSMEAGLDRFRERQPELPAPDGGPPPDDDTPPPAGAFEEGNSGLRGEKLKWSAGGHHGH